ncbi:hypothetical protein [Paenibacillus radicis (ex Gao et al. 2016)]|uniref:Uncharacterized protein n=1 Tax=Paenibacillus radicis (ex Gao et al. 2016) TaxID=1737354 RepID=A0A917M3L3_9BACL|nr:hypothetical protein [Paenibacillus radicis (ex Gao et al. 2016)]GGG74585.1 hypothetical protein GCM10010918_33440 [Paenibacillus radicis (ex Gao et al. 2016)]
MRRSQLVYFAAFIAIVAALFAAPFPDSGRLTKDQTIGQTVEAAINGLNDQGIVSFTFKEADEVYVIPPYVSEAELAVATKLKPKAIVKLAMLATAHENYFIVVHRVDGPPSYTILDGNYGMNSDHIIVYSNKEPIKLTKNDSSHQYRPYRFL